MIKRQPPAIRLPFILYEVEATDKTTYFQELPPWIPAFEADTTSGASEKAELHMVRAVETGIINVIYTSTRV